jgi:hypothetical protein
MTKLLDFAGISFAFGGKGFKFRVWSFLSMNPCTIKVQKFNAFDGVRLVSYYASRKRVGHVSLLGVFPSDILSPLGGRIFYCVSL